MFSKKPYVFISYASDNWATVFKKAVVPMQQKYGLRVYADKAFDKVNDKWIVPMLRNVRGADAVVAFISQKYIESYACFLEMLTAVNNRKPIIFVSLEEQLHLGDTTDQPVIERGAKSEILNQGGNIATNTNNTSNDIMRAMKSAYTSISTLLEQDALSKYDISDAFINFFRDASINRKTINDVGAIKGTIFSVSEGVFDNSLIGIDPSKIHTSSQAQSEALSEQVQDTIHTPAQAQPETPSEQVQYSARVQQNEPLGSEASDLSRELVRSGFSAAPADENRNDFTQPTACSAVAVADDKNISPSNNKNVIGGLISKLKENKKLLIIIGAAVVCVIAAIIIIAACSFKNVKDMPYVSNMLKEIYNIEEDLGMEVPGRYTGKWKNDMPYKKGVITFDYTNTEAKMLVTYDGEWSDGKANGQGILEVTLDGEHFSREGTWIDNKLNGHGKETDDDFSYEGEWSNSRYNGQGKMVYANGDVYEGEWLDGWRYGQGKMVYSNGDVYEGEWIDDDHNGHGKFTPSNGRIYEGEWKDNLASGQGKLTFENGDTWEGSFVNGYADGTGLYTYVNGTQEYVTYSNEENKNNNQSSNNDNNSDSASSSVYTVSLQAICEQNAFMNQYDIDVIVDNEIIDTLAHGTTKTYTLSLQAGNHYIGFRLNQFPTSKAGETLNIQGNASLSYGIRCTLGNNIEVVRA